MSVVTPKSFFSTYAQLISLSSDVSQESFYGTEDYAKLESLGPSLPKLAFPLPQAKDGTEEKMETVPVAIKSIKPPIKLAVSLNGVTPSQSIYKIKTQLVEDVPDLKNAGVSPANIKLMIKGKVLTDSTLISAVSANHEELSMIAMVSAPSKSGEKQEEQPVAAETPSREVRSATWSKIYDLLVGDLGEDLAESTLKRFKATTHN